MRVLSPIRVGIQPCGCIHESFKRYRVLRLWRCSEHSERYTLAEGLRSWFRRCDSCRVQRARYRVGFADGVSFALCEGCELPRSS